MKSGDEVELEADQEVVSEEPTEEEVVAEVTEEETTSEFNIDDDVNALLSGEDLSEEFKAKAKTIFEAALNSKVVEVKDATIEEAVTTKTSSTAHPALSIPKPVLKSSETRVKTRHGFEIELPPNMFENIVSSIEMTPHEGYKPVVSFGPRGEIMLNFEAI